MEKRQKLSYLYSASVSIMLVFAAVIASSFLTFTSGDLDTFTTELYSNALILILIGMIVTVAVLSLGFSSLITQLERSEVEHSVRLDRIDHRLESFKELLDVPKKD